MDVLDAIRSRRSVRSFRPDPVPAEALERVLDAARWAPSGLNNQPWRFVTVQDPALREALAALTKYGRILRAAPVAVAVLLETATSYHREKDLQAIGAAIQNLLLAAHATGLGACWLGEILNRRAEAEAALGVAVPLELAAVVALGVPAGDPVGQPGRLPLSSLIVGAR